MDSSFRFFCLILSMALLSACNGDKVSTPKPKGYFRINFPKKNYQVFDDGCAYTFSYPTYAKLEADRDRNALPCWKNLDFPSFNGVLHLTYYDVFSAKTYNEMTENARSLAMKHTIKADAIDQRIINYPDKKVYGIYYSIEGNTASSVQFFLTDSVNHYLRGALYFNERPAYDSIQPVISFIKQDIDKLIETFEWKNLGGEVKVPKTRAANVEKSVVDGSGRVIRIPKTTVVTDNAMDITGLETIQFEFSSSMLKTECYPNLDKLSFVLRDNGYKVTVAGHSSSEGTATYNMKLSKDRANAVKTYLVNAGVNASGIVVKGYGESRPVATNDTEEGRIQNRRVKVKIVYHYD